MKVLVAGGRDFSDSNFMFRFLGEFHTKTPISLIIEGGARGADRLARKWAEQNKIPVVTFPADWPAYGAGAGPRRNLQMFREGQPDVVVAFPGERGTRNMIQQAKTFMCPVIDLRYEQYGWVGSL